VLIARAPRGQGRSDRGAQIRMKAPRTKLQAPENLQSSNSKAPPLREVLGFGDWDFFGVWILVFGVCAAGFGVSFSRLTSGLNRRALAHPYK
jgi:hypothetical protein